MRFTPKSFRVSSYDLHQFTQPVAQIYARSYSSVQNSSTKAYLIEVESYFALHNAPFDSIRMDRLHYRKHH